MSEKASQLRALLQDKDRLPLRGIGAHDAVGARAAEAGGAHFVWLSGLELSTSLGLPDASVFTMTEMLAAAGVANRCSPLPVVIDADTGFGSLNSIGRMIAECEALGLAGICIEDKKFPKANSFADAAHDLEEPGRAARRISHAVASRSKAGLVVVARTEAFIAGSTVEDAVRRAEAYEAAGADVIFVHSKEATPRQIDSFCRAYQGRCPVMVSPTTYGGVSEAELAGMGVALVLYSNVGIRLAVKAMLDGMAELAARRTLAAVECRMLPLQELLQLQHQTRWSE